MKRLEIEIIILNYWVACCWRDFSLYNYVKFRNDFIERAYQFQQSRKLTYLHERGFTR